jgi:hypothetical protein
MQALNDRKYPMKKLANLLAQIGQIVLMGQANFIL